MLLHHLLLELLFLPWTFSKSKILPLFHDFQLHFRRPDEFIGAIQRKTELFRTEMTKAGFTILGQDHPISPVFLGDEKVALELSQRMLDEGIFVIAFAYPVVPKVCTV